MGLYDRDYLRDDEEYSLFGGGQRMMVTNLVIINVAIFIIDQFTTVTSGSQFGQSTKWLSDQMAVHVNTWQYPWLWWKFLTSGFAHSPSDIWHIALNMFMLWMFGRDVEQRYGPKEFLWFYLVTIVVGSVVWCLVENLAGSPGNAGMYGASGAVCGVLALFALNFPRRTILVMFVIPVPAWGVVLFMVLINIMGSVGTDGSNVAYMAHLGGFGFGFLYFWSGMRIGRFVPEGISFSRILKRQPRLRVHRPSDGDDSDRASGEVDRILAKIHSEGESSLTKKERRTLEDAARRYQQRRQ